MTEEIDCDATWTERAAIARQAGTPLPRQGRYGGGSSSLSSGGSSLMYAPAAMLGGYARDADNAKGLAALKAFASPLSYVWRPTKAETAPCPAVRFVTACWRWELNSAVLDM